MGGGLDIGIDLGGTKISAIGFSAGETVFTARQPTPRDDYAATLAVISALVGQAEAAAGISSGGGRVGIAMPGSVSPATGLVQNANSTWLNGRDFKADVEGRLARAVKFANDADCLALSEVHDGAGRGAASVFAVILGTGCGGGIVIDGRLLNGPHGISGEWGHTPLPSPGAEETPGPICWCGRNGCLESWISGPALAADHARADGAALDAQQVAARAEDGDAAARATLARHAGRVARGLAMVVNMIDPEVIVLGGGLSNMTHLAQTLPPLMKAYIFADHCRVKIRPAVHGDDSGVRGAARLWNEGACRETP